VTALLQMCSSAITTTATALLQALPQLI